MAKVRVSQKMQRVPHGAAARSPRERGRSVERISKGTMFLAKKRGGGRHVNWGRNEEDRGAPGVLRRGSGALPAWGAGSGKYNTGRARPGGSAGPARGAVRGARAWGRLLRAATHRSPQRRATRRSRAEGRDTEGVAGGATGWGGGGERGGGESTTQTPRCRREAHPAPGIAGLRPPLRAAGGAQERRAPADAGRAHPDPADPARRYSGHLGPQPLGRAGPPPSSPPRAAGSPRHPRHARPPACPGRASPVPADLATSLRL